MGKDTKKSLFDKIFQPEKRCEQERFGSFGKKA